LTRLPYALPGLGLAVALWLKPTIPSRIAAAAVVADIVSALLPWGVPRAGRSGFSYWVESLLYVAPLSFFAVAGVITEASWTALPQSLIWILLGIPTGIVLTRLTGIDLNKVRSGHLALLMGPSKASHAAARATAGLVGPVGEELFFRGFCLGLPAIDPVIGLLGSATFVTRHHLVKSPLERFDRRALLVELAAAALLTPLAMMSKSAYPGLVAHLINNAPMVLIQTQQVSYARGPEEW
jgi:membrane protease YdiL (CAAX protease family)